MYLRYYRHLLQPYLHEHFPPYEKLHQRTLELDKEFVAVLHERHANVFVDAELLREMRLKFLDYIERRKHVICKRIKKQCKIGTVGRWAISRKKKDLANIEITYRCYDSIYFQTWIESETLERICWNNIIPLVIIKGHCPYGNKPGIIFLID